MSILAATGAMMLKDPGREASRVTATRLSAREASCSVLLSGCDFKTSWTATGRRVRNIS